MTAWPLIMDLMPAELRKRLPPLYSQEDEKDPVAQVKYFTPWSNWTWYATEYDGDDRFFGLVYGFERELGYFSLKELMSMRGPMGQRIERDISWTPKPLSECKDPCELLNTRR